MQGILYFDGSFKEGSLTGGWLFISETKPPLISYGFAPVVKKGNSNSESAELRALSSGLRWLENVKSLTKLKIRGDCSGAVNAINKKSRPKNKVSAGYFNEIVSSLKKMNVPYSFSHIKREFNVLAHNIAKKSDIGGFQTHDIIDNPLKEKVVRILASHLWYNQGCPKDKDLDIWLEAESVYNMSFV